MASLPKTYKAAAWLSVDSDLTIIDKELKLPAVGEILVKSLACGVCHSDAMVRGGQMGDVFPIVAGHEVIGDVVAISDGECKWKVGDRVGGPWHGGHDHTCKACQRGLFQMCESEAINGVTRDGGYAEYVLLRTEAVVRVPTDVDPVEYAPVLCAGITVFNSIRKQNIILGELVAIQGLGGLGHLAVQYANKLGYTVVALSGGTSKREFATQLGAHEYIDTSIGSEEVNAKLQALGGAALIVATAPNAKAIGPLTGGLQPGGHLLVLSPSGMIEVDTAHLILKAITVAGYPSGHALDSEEAIAFSKLHDIKCLVEPFPLKDAQKAFEHLMSGKARFRAVLTMDK